MPCWSSGPSLLQGSHLRRSQSRFSPNATRSSSSSICLGRRAPSSPRTKTKSRPSTSSGVSEAWTSHAVTSGTRVTRARLCWTRPSTHPPRRLSCTCGRSARRRSRPRAPAGPASTEPWFAGGRGCASRKASRPGSRREGGSSRRHRSYSGKACSSSTARPSPSPTARTSASFRTRLRRRRN